MAAPVSIPTWGLARLCLAPDINVLLTHVALAKSLPAMTTLLKFVIHKE